MQQPTSVNASPERALLDRYCVTCHNEKLKTAGLMLDKMDVEKVPENAEVWEKVVRKVRTSAMPPAGLPRPDKATYDSLATYLETTIDHAAKTDAGIPTIHRLNRAESVNAVRDLLGIEVDGSSLLPPDDAGYGFDNIADVLSVSPTLLERYMSAAGKISRPAIGDPAIRATLETYNVPPMLRQDDRMSEDLPFGSHGGLAIRRNFPLDGEYVIRIRLRRTHNANINTGPILGLAEPHQLEVRLDGARIKLFTVGGEYPVKSRSGREEFLRHESETSLNTPKNKEPEGDKYEYTADAGLEVRFPAKAGSRVIGVDFLDGVSEPEGALQPHMAAFYSLEGYEGTPKRIKEVPPAVDQVTIGGPYNAN